MIRKTFVRILMFFLFIGVIENQFRSVSSLYLFSQTINKTPNISSTITGKVLTTDGHAVNLAMITITSDITQIVYSSITGIYTFSAEIGKNYTITPTKGNYLFSPVFLVLTNVQNDISEVNFTGYPFFRIAGTISDRSNRRVSNVKIVLSGDKNKEIFTSKAGQFVFDSLKRGSYTITPSLTPYSFDPEKYSFSDLNNDAVSKDFTAFEPPTYTLSGYIKDVLGNNLPNADIYLSGKNVLSTKSNDNGYYEFSGLVDGVYSIQAVYPGYAFTINSINITVSGNSTTNINFYGQKYYSLSGSIKENLQPISSVKLVMSGSKSAVAFSDSRGFFSFDSIFSTPITITPELYSYVFTPAAITNEFINANLTEQNFSAVKLELYSLSGKIKDQAGNPIKDVKVVLSGKHQMETLSLKDGAFSFANVEKGNYIITFYHSGYRFLNNSLPVDLSAGIDNLVINAAPYYIISGYCNNHSGVPLSNITIHLFNDSTNKLCLTDPDGKYTFDSLLTAGYKTYPDETGYKFNPVNITIGNLNKDYCNQNFTGEKIFKISGRIHDTNNKPLNHISVFLYGADTSFIYTDSAGLFSFDNIVEGNSKLVFRSNGMLFDPEEINYSPLTKDVSDVSVSGYITISGKALSLKALPVGSIKIFLTGSKTDSCITKDNGSFLFDHLPFGKYQLIPFGKNINFIPEYYSYDWLTESRYNQNITVMSTIYITGKISGIRSNPLKNITIGLSGGNNILTDSTGSFLFSDISEGDYTMIPLDTLYKFYPSKYEYAPLVSYKEEQNFTAKKIINISGQITDFKERPVCDVIIKQANDTTIRKSTDTLGNYSFQNIEAGSYVFTPYKKGCYFNPEKITLMNIDSSIHNLNIKNFFKICGIVMDSAFNPVPNVTLFLSGNLNKTAMTNNTGYFEFINLYSGNYSLALSKDGYRFYKDKINYTDLTTSIETDTFFVKKLPSISGIIRDFKNSPINDVIIAVTGDTAVLFHADGGFNIAGLKEGKYMLTPLKAGIKFKPPSISIDRLENDNNNLNFYGYVTISGKIIDSSQKTIPGILIRLIGERSSTSISDNEGNYYFDSLSFGKYIIIPTDKNLGFKPEQVIYQNLNGSVENLTFVSYSSLLNEVKTNSLIPSSQLLINYPNPFNNSTIIKFSIERESFVTLSIIDMLGREVCKLIDNEFLEANEYRLNWNGGTHINVSSGIYIYSLKIRNGNQTTIFNRKMILLK